jgi:hypothetical protein
LKVAAEWPEGDEFTMADVARTMDQNEKTVRSWQRNLGRTLRQVDMTLPEPRLLESRWDGQRNNYRVLPEVRDAIARQAL